MLGLKIHSALWRPLSLSFRYNTLINRTLMGSHLDDVTEIQSTSVDSFEQRKIDATQSAWLPLQQQSYYGQQCLITALCMCSCMLPFARGLFVFVFVCLFVFVLRQETSLWECHMNMRFVFWALVSSLRSRYRNWCDLCDIGTKCPSERTHSYSQLHCRHIYHRTNEPEEMDRSQSRPWPRESSERSLFLARSLRSFLSQVIRLNW